MKHQQVVVDYFSMFKTSLVYLALVLAGYILIRSMQAVFILPGQLKRNQMRLEQMAKHYEERMKHDERIECKEDDVAETPQTGKEIDGEKKKEK